MQKKFLTADRRAYIHATGLSGILLGMLGQYDNSRASNATCSVAVVVLWKIPFRGKKNLHGGPEKPYSRCKLVNQFAQGIFLVFPDAHTGLFLAKNPQKILAINNFVGQWNEVRTPK